MPPKTNPATKRGKKGGKARQPPRVEEEEVRAEEAADVSEAEEDEVDDAMEEETTAATTAEGARPKAKPKKKSNRVPHKDIEDYHFTPEQVTQMVDFLKAHPQMYDRKNREFCNTRAKLDLWQKCADLFTPTPTFLQCRKYFEQKRTAFGKIETFEMRSGSAARERTAREEEILETWSFLKGHIVHAATTPSQWFSSGHESSSSDMSGLSAHSMQRRRALKKKRVGEATPGTSTSTTPLTHLDLEAERNRVLGSLLEQASQLTGPRQPSTMMTSAEMYGKMMGEQLAMVEKEDLLSVVFPMLTILMNYFNNKRQQPQPTSLPQPTSMQAPPPPVPTPGPRFQMPGAGQQPPMQPGPAFAQPTYGQEQSTVFPVPSTSGYQQQQPPHMPPTPVSAYPPYSQQMPYSSGYQVPAMPFQSGPMQQQPSTSGYPATGTGRYPPPTPPVYTPISGASSGKPASTNTSPSKRPFLDSLDTISLSPYCGQTPSPLTPLTAGMARAFSGGSDSLNTPVTKANEDDKEDGDS